MTIEDVKKLFDFLYHRTYIPFAIVDEHKNLLFPRVCPILEDMETYAYLFDTDEHPLHIVNTYQMLAGSFMMEIEGRIHTIVLGPCLVLGNKEITSYHFLDKIVNPSHYVSTESLPSFEQALRSIYMMLLHAQVDKIPVKYIRKKTISAVKNQFEKNLYDRRSEEATRDSYQFELRFFSYIKAGRKDKIDWLFSKVNQTYIVHLSKQPLEGLKFKFASITALLTRTAIEAGTPLDTAFALSDALIQGLYEIKDVDACMRYIRYASFEFMDLIHKDDTQSHTAIIEQCVAYIDAHLYEKITLQDLSDVTQRSTAYLSSRFKEELGISFSQYVLQSKIEEAKQLLLFTDHSFQEIATLLNFATQSHFIQRFKEATGQTPKAFRDTNFQYL